MRILPMAIVTVAFSVAFASFPASADYSPSPGWARITNNLQPLGDGTCSGAINMSYALLPVDNSFFLKYQVRPDCSIIVEKYLAGNDPISAVGGTTLMWMYSRDFVYPIGNTVGLVWNGFGDCADTGNDVPHTYQPATMWWWSDFYHIPGTASTPCQTGFDGRYHSRDQVLGTIDPQPFATYTLGSDAHGVPVCNVFVQQMNGAYERVGCVFEGVGHQQDVEYPPFDDVQVPDKILGTIAPGQPKLLQVNGYGI